jgi:hypothetical protein
MDQDTVGEVNNNWRAEPARRSRPFLRSAEAATLKARAFRRRDRQRLIQGSPRLGGLGS